MSLVASSGDVNKCEGSRIALQVRALLPVATVPSMKVSRSVPLNASNVARQCNTHAHLDVMSVHACLIGATPGLRS